MQRVYRGNGRTWVLREAEEWGFYVERPAYDATIGKRPSMWSLDDEGEEGRLRPLLDNFMLQAWVEASRLELEEEEQEVKAQRLAWVNAVMDDVLNEEQRLAFLLHFFAGVGPTEIARQRGVCHSCPRVSLKRGIERMRAAARAATVDGVLRLTVEERVRLVIKAVVAGKGHEQAEWLQGCMQALLTRTERGAVTLVVGEGYSSSAAAAAMGLRARSVVWQATKSGMAKLCASFAANGDASREVLDDSCGELEALDKQAA